MKSYAFWLVTLALWLSATALTHGQLTFQYSADVKTVTSDTGDVNTAPVQTRLYLDDAFTIPAPVVTTLWFVADLNHDGVPAEHLGSAQVPLDQLLGPDDRLLRQDVLPGTFAGPGDGRYKGVVNVSGPAEDEAAFKNASIYVYLWNQRGDVIFENGDRGLIPAAGNSFGILDLGTHLPPAFGNAFWAIDRNISAAEFTVVPEPSDLAAALACGLVVWTLARRYIR